MYTVTGYKEESTFKLWTLLSTTAVLGVAQAERDGLIFFFRVVGGCQIFLYGGRFYPFLTVLTKFFWYSCVTWLTEAWYKGSGCALIKEIYISLPSSSFKYRPFPYHATCPLLWHVMAKGEDQSISCRNYI